MFFIIAKLHAEHSRVGGTKVYIHGPGHITKIAVMPTYGKNVHTNH